MQKFYIFGRMCKAATRWNIHTLPSGGSPLRVNNLFHTQKRSIWIIVVTPPPPKSCIRYWHCPKTLKHKNDVLQSRVTDERPCSDINPLQLYSFHTITQVIQLLVFCPMISALAISVGSLFRGVQTIGSDLFLPQWPESWNCCLGRFLEIRGVWMTLYEGFFGKRTGNGL